MVKGARDGSGGGTQSLLLGRLCFVAGVLLLGIGMAGTRWTRSDGLTAGFSLEITPDLFH